MSDPWTVGDLAEARQAVWADPDWDGGTDHCVRQVRSMLAATPDTAGAVFVEIGVGVGRLLFPLAGFHTRAGWWGLDTSPSMADLFQHEARDAPNVYVAYPDDGDGPAWLRRQAGLVAGVYSVVTFQHLTAEEQAAYVQAASVALRPGGRLVVQWVSVGDIGPLCHPVPVENMTGWVEAAGLRVASTLLVDHRYPTWSWLAAEKPTGD